MAMRLGIKYICMSSGCGNGEKLIEPRALPAYLCAYLD